jgi:uncharacterized membrane protein YcfT
MVAAWRQTALAVIAAGAYVVREISNYEFGLLQALILAVLVGRLVSLLIEFRREDLTVQPSRPVSLLLKFAGRHSLEIYAASLLVMQIAAYVLGS